MSRTNLQKAKDSKNDEFYTLLRDIENELRHYKAHFKNKVVYLNCDDPEHSNFWQYFMLNFEFLGLKKLISTHYHDTEPTYKLEYYGVNEEGERVPVRTDLEQNGDFRSPESIELLKESDIVVTNPPFSLFREYVAQLMKYEKQFLIVGNYNSVTYKEIFQHIKSNRFWIGVSPRSMDFRLPDGSLKGVNACWYTNLDHTKRHEQQILYREYNKETYKEYGNYDGIEVSKVADIPKDYKGVMGVPITFLEKYNPEQFEIIGLGTSRDHFTPNKDYIKPLMTSTRGTGLSGDKINYVLTLEHTERPIKGTYYTSECTDKYITLPYARVLIKNKNPQEVIK